MKKGTVLILKFAGSYLGIGMLPMVTLGIVNHLVSPGTDWMYGIETSVWTAQVGWTCAALWMALRMFPEMKADGATA